MNWRKHGQQITQLLTSMYHLPFTGILQRSMMMVPRCAAYIFPYLQCGDQIVPDAQGGVCLPWRITRCIVILHCTWCFKGWFGLATSCSMDMTPKIQPGVCAEDVFFVWQSWKATGNGIRLQCVSALHGKVWRKYAFCAMRVADLLTLECCTIVWMRAQVGSSTIWQNFWRSKWHLLVRVSWTSFKFWMFGLRGLFTCLPSWVPFPSFLPSFTPGPYILLHGFHPEILQPCSMHAINLGVLYDVNGSCMILCRVCCMKQDSALKEGWCSCYSC